MYPRRFGKNPLFPSKKDFGVVSRDANSGMGVITYTFFPKGALVCALAGEIITDIRQHSLQIEPGVHLYDTFFSGFFLHSCSPNIFLDIKKLLVWATRDIQPMEYLLMDYAQTEDHLFKQFPCSCGSKNCRGWITGRNEVPMNHTDSKDHLHLPGLQIDERQSV